MQNLKKFYVDVIYVFLTLTKTELYAEADAGCMGRVAHFMTTQEQSQKTPKSATLRVVVVHSYDFRNGSYTLIELTCKLFSKKAGYTERRKANQTEFFCRNIHF